MIVWLRIERSNQGRITVVIIKMDALIDINALPE